MVVVIAEKYKNNQELLRQLTHGDTSKKVIVSKGNIKDISISTKDSIISKPITEKVETLESNKNLQSLIKSAYVTQAQYNPAPSGTAVPSKIVDKTVSELKSYGLDYVSYLGGLPSLNKTDKEFKTDTLLVLTDYKNDLTDKGMTVNLPEIKFPDFNFKDIFSGLGNAGKWVTVALVSVAVIMLVKD